MSTTWQGRPPPAPPARQRGDLLRMIARLVALALLLLVGLVALGLLRLGERIAGRADRPASAYVPRFFSRAVIAVLGISYRVEGRAMRHSGAVVANHGSWLDILALNAAINVFFVAKAEVAGWAGIGFLAKAAGTVFIRRDRREAAQQAQTFETRLRLGHRLLFFPEGTSTDTQVILPFKTTLFQAFFSEDLKGQSWVQPVRLRYSAPRGEDPRYYGWWGSMALLPHLKKLLAAKRGGRITVIFTDPIAVRDMPDRKALAARSEEQVRRA